MLFNYAVVFILILLSGLFSGLTLGLLSLDTAELERKKNLGDVNAAKIYPVRKNGNLLLTTLLLGNVAVNATLSLFLGGIANGLIAGVLSTVLIVLFGEILPQATISRNALQIGAKTIWVTRFFLFLFYPVTKPIALLLDRFLGDEIPTIWSKDELKEIIKAHEDSPHSAVDRDEERIILGALSFSHKTAKDVMTPRTMIFALEVNDILDEDTLATIAEKRFSRISVFSKELDAITGVLYGKDLIGISSGLLVRDLYKSGSVLKISAEKKLDELLDRFLKERNQIAFVYDEFGTLLGLVTLEDVVEEILQREVYDEGERLFDPRKAALLEGKRIENEEKASA